MYNCEACSSRYNCTVCSENYVRNFISSDNDDDKEINCQSICPLQTAWESGEGKEYCSKCI
jgi:hypothetical protein